MHRGHTGNAIRHSLHTGRGPQVRVQCRGTKVIFDELSEQVVIGCDIVGDILSCCPVESLLFEVGHDKEIPAKADATVPRIGGSRAMRTPMMAITTSSSTKVKAVRKPGRDRRWWDKQAMAKNSEKRKEFQGESSPAMYSEDAHAQRGALDCLDVEALHVDIRQPTAGALWWA